MEFINLEPKFSTTRIVTREKPTIANDSFSKVQSFLFLPSNPERKGEGGLRTKGYFKRSYNEVNGLFSNSTLPLVTIITVVFNGDKYLERTIQSVINQTYDNVEYIIIDGGSTDRTLDIIRKHEKVIDYWISETDRGIYDAMNKGIILGTGEIIGLINSDDWYLNDAIANVVEQYIKNSCQNEKLIIAGSMFRTDSNGNVKFKNHKSEKFLTHKIKWTMPVNHPATFISSDVYKTIGLYNIKYKICGDHDFIYRAYFSQNIKFLIVNNCFAFMSSGGVSSQFKNILLMSKEHYQIRKQNTFFVINILMFALKICVKIFKEVLKFLLTDKLISIYYYFAHRNLK